MNLNFWKTCSTYAGRAVLFLGICTAVSLFVRTKADDEIIQFYRERQCNKLDSQMRILKQIDDRLPLMPKRLFASVTEGTKEGSKLRGASCDKYENKDYHGALIDIEQAIQIVDTNPWGFFLRALIYSGLYSEIHPGSYSELNKATALYADSLFKEAESDYKKAIELSKGENDEVSIYAKMQLLVLKWDQAGISGCIDTKMEKRLKKEIQKESAALLAQFPDKEYVKHYSELIKVYGMDWDEFKEYIEQREGVSFEEYAERRRNESKEI